jgi:hypothetical protein
MLTKSNWRNVLPAVVAALAAPVIVAVQTTAATTATVAATVTPQNISVSVADGSVAYGTLAVSTTKDTTSGGVNDSQTATNDGNVAEDFNITSTHATGGTQWTLAGTIGADQYKHSFCNTGSGSPDPCDTGATWNAITTAGAYQTLGTNIATSGTSKFDLQISTPSSVSDYTLKSITVTVQAVLH